MRYTYYNLLILFKEVRPLTLIKFYPFKLLDDRRVDTAILNCSGTAKQVIEKLRLDIHKDEFSFPWVSSLKIK
jgi:hypothetical protein